MKTKISNKFVTFLLGETIFGIAVLKTKEIVEYGKITPVPEAPEYIKGVINLRGSVIPVVDLTKKFFGEDTKSKETTSIMIVETEIDNDASLMGLIVDCVKDVIEIKEENLGKAPKYGTKLKSEYILNVAAFDEEFILVLDIDKVISHIEINENITKFIDKESNDKINYESNAK